MRRTPAHMPSLTRALIDVKMPHQWHNAPALPVVHARTAYARVNSLYNFRLISRARLTKSKSDDVLHFLRPAHEIKIGPRTGP